MNERPTTGQTWRNLKTWHKKKRARNRRASAALLSGFGIAFDSNNDGAHLIVRHNNRVVDFFPTTGYWADRSTSSDRQRGVFELIAYLNDGEPIDRSMAQRVSDGKAFDVGCAPQIINDAEPRAIGAFDLSRYYRAEQFDGRRLDFVLLRTGETVESIGQVPDGRILAALDSRFVIEQPGGRCLWVRS